MALPAATKYLIIGAGIHGLSTAWHLGEALRRSGRGSGKDILVVDKSDIAAGASGIACGVIRNNYYQPAMRRLMAHSVSVWESDPEAFSYHPVGYMQISPEVMHSQVASIAQQQKEIGYESVFIEGAKESTAYMKGLFDDWQARGITSVLHEKKGGYANNTASIRGLAKKAEQEGVRILTSVKVTGFKKDTGGAVRTVLTNQGNIDCDTVVVGAGPWVKQIWDMLELPAAITIKGRDGNVHDNVAMWTFWSLQEGTLGVDPDAPADQRRRAAAGDPRRHRCDALFRRRPLRHHGPHLGHLLQTGFQFRRRTGRCHALQGQGRSGESENRSLRAGVAGFRGRRGFRPYVVLGTRLLSEAIRGQAAAVQKGTFRGHRVLYGRQFPGIRPFLRAMCT